MLIEFRAENHRSIRTEQVLNMEGPTNGYSDSNSRADVLPVAGIYGANASGKSNVLSALQFMRDAVVFSHRSWPPEAGVARDPFAWGDTSSTPSLFEVTFRVDDVRYQYGFEVDDDEVREEWLFAWPHGRRQLWFQREREQFTFGDSLHGEKAVVEKVTRANSLFLAAAAQNKHEQIAPLFRWFTRLRSHNVPRPRSTPPVLASAGAERWFAAQSDDLDEQEQKDMTARLDLMLRFLRAADIGVLDVKVERDESRRFGRNRVFLLHRSDSKEAWLPLEEESLGTRQLFRLAPLVVNALLGGGVLLVDELEKSFHPLLALSLVELFTGSENTSAAQLIFTTHDTNLLGTTRDRVALERSQVWFTEKDDNGGTRLYPLTDYKPRKGENLERGYLQGRYGAVPFLGDIADIGRRRP